MRYDIDYVWEQNGELEEVELRNVGFAIVLEILDRHEKGIILSLNISDSEEG